MLLEKFRATWPNPDKLTPLPKEVLTKYSTNIPPEILELWKYGAGSYMNDFFWVVNPEEFENSKNEIYLPFSQPCVAFARSAFGDLFVWEKDLVKFINVRYTYSEVVGRNLQVFFNTMATNWSYLTERLKVTNFDEVREKLGSINNDECYGYVPILAAGGMEKTENLRKVKIKEHLSIIAQMAGRIE